MLRVHFCCEDEELNRHYKKQSAQIELAFETAQRYSFDILGVLLRHLMQQ